MGQILRLIVLAAGAALAGKVDPIHAQDATASPASNGFSIAPIAFRLESDIGRNIPVPNPVSLGAAAPAIADEAETGSPVAAGDCKQPKEIDAVQSIDAPTAEVGPSVPGTIDARRTLSDPYAPRKVGWTRDLTALEITFQIANALDAVTTHRCVRRTTCHEVNPLFGKKPSAGVIYGAKAAAGLIHYFGIDMLARSGTGTARTVAWITAIFQTGIVGLNVSESF